MEFKRTNKNSKLLCTFLTHEVFEKCENDENMILQIAQCGEKEGRAVYVIEYINREAPQSQSAISGDMNFENYLNTVINRDPFGGRYANRPIKDVFKSGDEEWLNKALKELKNDFLRDRLQYIVNRGGYGKIICK